MAEDETEKKAESKNESKAIGGLARAQSLTKERRSDIAKRAASARWQGDMPEATHEGRLKFGDIEIGCCVVDGERRLLSEREFTKGLGAKRGGSHWLRKKENQDGAELPVFLSANNLRPFIPHSLMMALNQPVRFKTRQGQIAHGIPAEIIPEICEVFLKAREAGKLVEKQKPIAQRAELITRALAQVGIVALIDEVTGFQYARARNALTEILEKFISKELLKWVKTFPDEFYYHIFRLRGWQASEKSGQRTPLLGKITNDLVYERLAPGVLDQLKKVTVRNDKGKPKHKYFQRLTDDVGHPKLREHLASEITLMRIFNDGEWAEFYKALNRALPKQVKLPLFDKLDGLEKEE